MGSISERKTKDGQIRYRAVIRINKNGIKYSESRTFSKKNLAQSWLTKREQELKDNPKLLFGAKKIGSDLTVAKAIDR